MFPKSRPALLSAWLLTAACGGSATQTVTHFPTDPALTVASANGLWSMELRTGPTQPPGRDVVTVQYKVKDAQGAAVDGLALQITPWMPAMGHGTSVTPTVDDQGEGIYEVSNVYFYMPGEWDLRTQLSQNSTVDDATPSFEIP
jgi:hypothetical protein